MIYFLEFYKKIRFLDTKNYIENSHKTSRIGELILFSPYRKSQSYHVL